MYIFRQRLAGWADSHFMSRLNGRIMSTFIVCSDIAASEAGDQTIRTIMPRTLSMEAAMLGDNKSYTEAAWRNNSDSSERVAPIGYRYVFILFCSDRVGRTDAYINIAPDL